MRSTRVRPPTGRERGKVWCPRLFSTRTEYTPVPIPSASARSKQTTLTSVPLLPSWKSGWRHTTSPPARRTNSKLIRGSALSVITTNPSSGLPIKDTELPDPREMCPGLFREPRS